MDFYYVNHNGKRIDLSDYPYLFQSGDILDWIYTYDTSEGKRNQVSNFRKVAKEFSVKIAVLCDFSIPLNERQEEWNQAVDSLVELFEEDVIEGQEGKLYSDTGYYMNCMIIGSTKSDWKMGLPVMFNTLKLISSNPGWTKEHPYYFKSSEITSTDNKRYAGKYAYRYANGLTNTAIINEHYAECNFRLIVYGPCTQPSIYIGGYEYRFNIVLQEGEYLEVDSAEETVTKYMKSGVKINAFNNRNFKNSVFQPIQTGRQEVSWNGRFDFDIIMYEERSEPKWS